ncbi:heparinase II/III domain-containing protein [Bifidobacterium vespertilionis]|uniref:Heparinase n=2 Tax=Bifidobacterium vespertilionis TaxID=2562524 RepID=A0A5J5DVN3_9BIFI|nr:heparinase II/III family protein [Bifidobacterium vespertilionis]KAA8820915.1 heparinase [Bifidobacterium vespertilionis]KAA8822699.1 heparinase [Bifidobacterium vespertilionis]
MTMSADRTFSTSSTSSDPSATGARVRLFSNAWASGNAAQSFQPFQPFRPFAPADDQAADRDAWRSLPPFLAALHRRRAAAHRERPWPRLFAHDWARFFRDGDRMAYEMAYGEMRRRVADDLMAYGVARTADGPEARECGALLADIIDGISIICGQSAWQLPAHNAYVRDAPQLPWPDPDRPLLDLFACETGQLLAAALYVLGDDLPEPIRRRVEGELDRRIIAPYLGDRFWWMGDVDGPTNNWTVWCTQNVLLTAFLAPFGLDTRHAVVTRACASLDSFLSDYGEDGCCSEGAGYYHTAGLCLFGAMRVLADVRPDAFGGLWRERRIANIATYIMRVRIGEDRYFNFSDCAVKAGLMGAREFLFARAVGDDGMARAAALEWRHAVAAGADTTRTPATGMDRINTVYLLWEAGAAGEMLDESAGPNHPAGLGGDCVETWFPSTGIAVMRGGGFDVGVKAGRNGFSHSHNDTGSVIVWRDGHPVLIDAGAGTYTRQTFSPQRYELWTMQSSWHNLPDFDGVMQRETPECRASDVKVTFEPEESSVSADLTHAWPASAGLRSYVRTVTLSKRDGALTIRDIARGTFGTATMHLLTAEEPKRVPGNAIALRVGDAMLEMRGTDAADSWIGPITIEPKPLEDAKLRADWDADRLWRINVPFRGGLIVEVR